MRITQSFKCFYFYLLFGYTTVHAAWVGPVQVLTGGWGSGTTEFYKEGRPPYETLPILYDVSSAGQIVITDKLNGRIKIYGPDGALIRNITPPVANPKRWSMKPKFIGQNVVINIIFIPIRAFLLHSRRGQVKHIIVENLMATSMLLNVNPTSNGLFTPQMAPY
jgi:hypothetical protein